MYPELKMYLRIPSYSFEPQIFSITSLHVVKWEGWVTTVLGQTGHF